MRRVMFLALSVLMVVSMAISPALAHDRDGDGCDEDHWSCNWWNRDDGKRHDGKGHHGNRHRNNAEFCVVYVFVPFGFWNLDWFGNWFWQDLGSDWQCRD